MNLKPKIYFILFSMYRRYVFKNTYEIKKYLLLLNSRLEMEYEVL